MLFIFRQLRRLELRKRGGQYFLYAFGEIVLIVVGILIALQIQNWNEGRRDRIKERYLLEELVDNLNQEAERLEQGLVGINGQIEAVEVIEAYFKERSYTKDDLEKHLSYYLGSFSFQPISSAYDTMKSTEVGFSSRSMKAELIDYYERWHPLLQFLVQAHREINSTETRPFLMKHLESVTRAERAVIKNVEDPDFRESLLGLNVIFKNLFPNIRTHVEDLLNKNRELLALVEQELERM
jgi:hypothetical protein